MKINSRMIADFGARYGISMEKATRILERWEQLKKYDKATLKRIMHTYRRVYDDRGIRKADMIPDIIEVEFGKLKKR